MVKADRPEKAAAGDARFREVREPRPGGADAPAAAGDKPTAPRPRATPPAYRKDIGTLRAARTLGPRAGRTWASLTKGDDPLWEDGGWNGPTERRLSCGC